MAKLILDKQLPSVKEKIIMDFLFYYISFEFSETKTKFDYEVNLLTNKNIENMMTMQDAIYEYGEATGFYEGKKEGKKEGKENEVYGLITKLGFSDQQIVEYANVSVTFIKKIRAKIKSGKLVYS